MCKVCSTNGSNISLHRILEGATNRKRPLRILRRRPVNNNKVHHREVEWSGMDGNNLVQNRDEGKVLMNTVINLEVS